MTNDALLQVAISTAVPLRMMEIRERFTAGDWPWLEHRARECGDIVASQGDAVLYRTSIKGQSAEVFNRLAEAVAIGAFCPGGITVFGQHFEDRLDDDPDYRTEAARARTAAMSQVVHEMLYRPEVTAP